MGRYGRCPTPLTRPGAILELSWVVRGWGYAQCSCAFVVYVCLPPSSYMFGSADVCVSVMHAGALPCSNRSTRPSASSARELADFRLPVLRLRLSGMPASGSDHCMRCSITARERLYSWVGGRVSCWHGSEAGGSGGAAEACSEAVAASDIQEVQIGKA